LSVHSKTEALPGHSLITIRQRNLHESKGATRFGFDRSDARQQLITRTATALHGAQFSQQSNQPSPPHGHLLGTPSLALGQHEQLLAVGEQLHLH
jgi:hypothetical protein